MPLLNLVHINLHVSDLDRSIDFYERLGFSVMHDLGRNAPRPMQAVEVSPLSQHGGGMVRGAVMSLGDDPRCATKIELIQYVDPAPTARPLKPNHEVGVHRIAIRVKDIDATVADLRATGIAIPSGPHEVRTMGGRQRYVLFPDPDETMLELIELYRA